MSDTAPPTDAEQHAAQRLLLDLRTQLGRVIVGQEALIEQLLIALFAGGHVLLEGLPGLGKTHLAKALAGLLGLHSARVQCTPDLMPADITGTEVFLTQADGSSAFRFRPGPLFAQLVLVDEINRATPRTQAALLEAMQEGQVTQGGQAHRLPQPFCVLATQNPIELEGTYPLPEAQLDRFLFKLQVPFPRRDALLALLEVALDGEPSEALQPLCDAEGVRRTQALCRSQLLSSRCKQAAVDLVLATQPDPEATDARRQLRYGASPRALQALLRAARVRSLMQGRPQVDVEDLAAVALPVLRHRVLLRLEAELDGLDADRLLGGLIAAWRARA